MEDVEIVVRSLICLGILEKVSIEIFKCEWIGAGMCEQQLIIL